MKDVILRRLLVGIALVAVVAHVCALPAHAEGFHEMGAGPAGAPHHDESPGEALHAASCKAASSGLGGHAVAPTVARWLPAPGSWPARPLGPVVPLATFTESPPLFLLHASLLV